MKLCVFPNDSLEAYYRKGEIKERYFNPNNVFNEIHVISPTEHDVDESKVKKLAGDAKLKIHCIGNLNLLNFKSKLSRINQIIIKLQPDVIRAYNPLMQGWLATKTAKIHDIPCVVSIHNNYDKDSRQLYKRSKKYFQYFKFLYTGKFLEPNSIKQSDIVICAYRFLEPYAKRMGAKNIQVIYNRVNLSRFSPDIKPELDFEEPTIIYVSRLDSEKNHECLIKAIKELKVKLILIGDGPLYGKLLDLTKSLKCEKKVFFLKSVPNEELGKYYTSADIFASSTKQGGISIPMLEAMTCGLPLIIPEREDNEHEDIDDAVMFAKNNPEDFKNKITKLIDDTKLREDLIQKGFDKMKSLDGTIMERKEEEIYRDILKK